MEAKSPMGRVVRFELDGPECPLCRGWNCTAENPHAAWMKGTNQNALVRADRAAREEVE